MVFSIAVCLWVAGRVVYLYSDDWREKHGIPADWYKTRNHDHGE